MAIDLSQLARMTAEYGSIYWTKPALTMVRSLPVPERGEALDKRQNDGSGIQSHICMCRTGRDRAHPHPRDAVPNFSPDMIRHQCSHRIAREFINQRRAPDRQHRTYPGRSYDGGALASRFFAFSV